MDNSTILGVPLSFFFLALFISLLILLFILYVIRKLCMKYRICLARVEIGTVAGAGTIYGSDEKPPEYDDAIKCPVAGSLFTILPSYSDAVGQSHLIPSSLPSSVTNSFHGDRTIPIDVHGVHNEEFENFAEKQGGLTPS